MSAARQIQVALPFTPYAHQRAAHDLRLANRFLVLVWHRRGGKTVFSIAELVLAALACTRERGRYGYIAPFLKQAKGIAWDYLKAFARVVPGTSINESELWVEFANGARVRIFGADNPDSIRGLYFDGVVKDEVAQMRPEIWGEIIRPALSDRKGWAIFIGTPKGVNLFSDLYQRALRGEEDWAADMRRAEETGVLSAEEIEKARREMSDAEYAQEYGCDFSAAAEDVLIKLDAVVAAQGRVVGEDEYNFAGKVLGVDCARYGDDRSCLFPRQGLVAFKPRILKDQNTMDLAGHVCEFIDRWEPDAVFIDMGAMGPGVVDRCVQLGKDVLGVDFSGKPVNPKYANKRAEMWGEMAEWIRVGCLPDASELRKELPGPRFTYRNARGCMQLESKEDMRKRGVASPDVGDALALTFAFQVSKRLPAILEQNLQRSRADYDPFRSV